MMAKKYFDPHVSLILLSTLISSYLFFHNPMLSAAFDSSKDNIEWYAVLSQTIFEPQSFYIAESILLPLLAKILNANETTITFRVLCSILTISILPIITIYYHARHHNFFKSLLLVTILAISFRYLYAFNLGFPDPLTIILVTIAALSNRPLTIFLASFFAALSHFSMALVAFALLAILLFLYERSIQKNNLKTIAYFALGLLIGKTFLFLWNFIFSYRLITRTDLAFEYGMEIFINRYNGSPQEFWLLPGAAFLIIYLSVTLYFLFLRKYVFTAALCCSLGIAFLTCFFTLDGLRVFAVIIAPMYVVMLALFIENFYPGLRGFIVKNSAVISDFQLRIKQEVIYIALSFPLFSFWLFLIKGAKNKGLLINDTRLLNALDLADNTAKSVWLTLAIFMFITTITPAFRQKKLLSHTAKVIFLLPLVTMGIQYVRQLLAPNESLSLMMKILCGVVFVVIPLVFVHFNLTRRVTQLKSFLNGRFQDIMAKYRVGFSKIINR